MDLITVHLRKMRWCSAYTPRKEEPEAHAAAGLSGCMGAGTPGQAPSPAALSLTSEPSASLHCEHPLSTYTKASLKDRQTAMSLYI